MLMREVNAATMRWAIVPVVCIALGLMPASAVAATTAYGICDCGEGQPGGL